MSKSFSVLCAVVVSVAACSVAFADTVLLANGTKLEGEVSDGGDVWIIRSTSGIVTRIAKHEVASIKRSESAFDFFEKKRRELSVSDRAGEADAWFELGVFAEMSELPAEAKRSFQRALDLDMDHEGAKDAIAKYQRKAPARNATPGLTWEAREKKQVQRTAARTDRPQGSGLKFKNWVPCPKCNGTKYEVWLTCHQCDQSERPGYLFFGNYVTICNRCNGKTKYPGFSCRYCKGFGKIDGDNPPKPRERHVPGGYELCMKCQGTGVETWLPCPQCSRSPWDGLLDMGEYVLPCNRCGAKGRIPGIRCSDCRGHGIHAERR